MSFSVQKPIQNGSQSLKINAIKENSAIKKVPRFVSSNHLWASLQECDLGPCRSGPETRLFRHLHQGPADKNSHGMLGHKETSDLTGYQHLACRFDGYLKILQVFATHWFTIRVASWSPSKVQVFQVKRCVKGLLEGTARRDHATTIIVSGNSCLLMASYGSTATTNTLRKCIRAGQAYCTCHQARDLTQVVLARRRAEQALRCPQCGKVGFKTKQALGGHQYYCEARARAGAPPVLSMGVGLLLLLEKVAGGGGPGAGIQSRAVALWKQSFQEIFSGRVCVLDDKGWSLFVLTSPVYQFKSKEIRNNTREVGAPSIFGSGAQDLNDFVRCLDLSFCFFSGESDGFL